MALTEKDLDFIEKIIEEKISHLPTREEFHQRMDEAMGELQAIRQEHTLMSHRLSDHEDRVASLEKIHPDGQHSS